MSKQNSLNNCVVELNGEYAICWKDDNIVYIGPEQIYGTICCPFNLFYDVDLDVVNQFIVKNNLTIPNSEDY